MGFLETAEPPVRVGSHDPDGVANTEKVPQDGEIVEHLALKVGRHDGVN